MSRIGEMKRLVVVYLLRVDKYGEPLPHRLRCVNETVISSGIGVSGPRSLSVLIQRQTSPAPFHDHCPHKSLQRLQLWPWRHPKEQHCTDHVTTLPFYRYQQRSS